MSASGSLPVGRYRLADGHRDRAGLLAEDAFRPQVPGVVRDRNHRHVERDGEARAAGLVLGARAGPDARAFRINDDPESLLEAFAALRGDLLHRVNAGLAVDGDRRGQREAPAEERDRQQLLLRHIGQGWESIASATASPMSNCASTGRYAGTSALPGGTFSRPSTRHRIPQIARAPHRFTAHQLAAIL